MKTTETVKGKEFPEAFRVQVKNPPELVKGMAAIFADAMVLGAISDDGTGR